jgi:porin
MADMTPLRASLPVLILLASSLLPFVDKPVAAQEGFFERDRLTGDWGGLRKEWEDTGVALGVTDVSETLSNPTGGVRQLSIYQGLLDVSLNLDLDKLLNWPSATFYADGYWISGEGLSRNRSVTCWR